MAKSKLYVNPETPLKFADSAQSPDKVLTLANLAAGAGRISARHDLGAEARSEWYEWRGTFQHNTNPVVGETIDLYVSTSDGTDPDGQEGVADAALGTTGSLKNMHYVDSVIVTSSSTNHDMTASGVFRMVARYFSVVVHNNTATALRNDTGVNKVMITPIPPEGQ